jgi:hypothetical protein
VLERQERYQECLNLAQAEGQLDLYVLVLARLGRVLREWEELAAALRVTGYGMTVEGDKGDLATWPCDLADGMGKAEHAINAATVAFWELVSKPA